MKSLSIKHNVYPFLKNKLQEKGQKSITLKVKLKPNASYFTRKDMGKFFVDNN